MALRDHRMIVSRSLNAALLAVAFSMFGTSAFATVVDLVAEGNVLNEDFEDNAVDFSASVPGSQGTTSSLIPHWDIYHPEGRVSSDSNYGVFEPVGGNYYDPNPGTGKIAYLDLLSGEGVPVDPPGSDGQYIAGLQQTLTKTSGPGEIDYSIVRKNSRYELEVQVGNPKTGTCCYYDGFGGYRVELLADTEVIKSVEAAGSADNDQVPIGEGKFVPVSVVVLPEEIDVGLIGKALGIRLVHKNAMVQPSTAFFWWGVGFDDVSLSVSAVPVPAAVWLFGTALLGLFGFGKRRKTA